VWDWVSPLGRSSSPAHAAGGGNVICLRSRQWFFDRPKEVPLRLVRQWRELSDRHGALPLEAYLQMATSLNDGQLATLGNLAGEGVLPYELHGLSILDSARSVLRLYASLTSRQ